MSDETKELTIDCACGCGGKLKLSFSKYKADYIGISVIQAHGDVENHNSNTILITDEDSTEINREFFYEFYFYEQSRIERERGW